MTKMNYNTIISKVYFLRILQKPAVQTKDKLNTSIVKFEGKMNCDEYRVLYLSVGEKLNWLDRLFIDDAELYEIINAQKTHIFKFFIQNEYAGYCELVEKKCCIEILYFGLIPDFIGKGYGNYFLKKTIDLAWSFTPKWIQLNTCDLDHRNALKAYLNAGFKLYRTIREPRKVKSP